jgi:hypothetical protein
MQMASQSITELRGARLMQKHEGPIDYRRIHAQDSQPGRGISRAFVVIAADQEKLQQAVAGAPLRQRFERSRHTTGPGMQSIAEHDYPAAIRLFDRARQTSQIVRRPARGHRDGIGTQRGGFAPVRIGQEQRPAPMPVDGALR